MSKLTEYLKLIPKGVKNLDKIVEGVYNNANFSNLSLDKQEEIIIRRAKCAECPFMSKNATTSKEFKELTGEHYTTSRTDDHCAMCGCPLLLRTAALEKNCGLEDWNEDNPNKKQPLKWEAYANKSDQYY